jgi:SAM-dependent MidA family methyltransferase
VATRRVIIEAPAERSAGAFFLMATPPATALRDAVIQRIRERGPMTFADYMAMALYEPELGYYARTDQRSGRAGDFFTSVDVGPAFGSLLAVQFAEMWRIAGGGPIELVEAGAGNGRLSRDVLDAAAAEHPDFYDAIRLTLVEASPAARHAHRDTLAGHGSKLVCSAAHLCGPVRGIIFANELLDALPAHAVVMQPTGLREIFVAERDGRLVEEEGPVSTNAIETYLADAGVSLPAGCRAEVGLRAIEWVRAAARSLSSGFLMLVDYGHEATELYSIAHAAGTIASCSRHTVSSLRTALDMPGEHDLTVHVDLTSVRRAAEAEGLITLAVMDQTYFLLGLGAVERLARTPGSGIADTKRRLALKTLLLPGGLGSTHKVMIFGRGVGRPVLAGTSRGARLT